MWKLINSGNAWQQPGEPYGRGEFLANRFTALSDQLGGRLPPDYPIAYDAGKILHTRARAKGDDGFGAQWAGQGAPLIREMPAAQLVQILRKELQTSLA